MYKKKDILTSHVTLVPTSEQRQVCRPRPVQRRLPSGSSDAVRLQHQARAAPSPPPVLRSLAEGIPLLREELPPAHTNNI